MKLKDLINEIGKDMGGRGEIPPKRPSPGTVSNVSNKPTIHLSYYKEKFVLVGLHDKEALDSEYGENNYGHKYSPEEMKGWNTDSTEPMTYFTIEDVIALLGDFNVFLTD